MKTVFGNAFQQNMTSIIYAYPAYISCVLNLFFRPQSTKGESAFCGEVEVAVKVSKTVLAAVSKLDSDEIKCI